MPEYEAWKENLGNNASGWSIKYYKVCPLKSLWYTVVGIQNSNAFQSSISWQGLGTSTSKEGKEYFQDLDKHKKDFIWVDEQDGDAIELAFSKKKIEARKNWLRQFEVWKRLVFYGLKTEIIIYFWFFVISCIFCPAAWYLLGSERETHQVQ